MKKILAATILCAFSAMAQDVKLVILDKPDTAQLKEAYKEFKEAQKKWEDLKLKVAKAYVLEDGKVPEDWKKVIFSKDFRAMVPEHTVSYGGYLTTINATGTSSNVLVNNASNELSTSLENK